MKALLKDILRNEKVDCFFHSGCIEILEKENINESERKVIIKNFKEWKQSSFHLFFGVDKPYHDIDVDGEDDILKHVHLIPTNKLEQEKWTAQYEALKRLIARGKEPRERRTSDRALVYVKHPSKNEYLILDIFPDDKAHDLAKNRAVMNKIKKRAEDYILKGIF